MEQVHWGELEPGTLEKVIARLLGRIHERAIQITPSKGDGGIDVLVEDHPNGATVYQVKSYCQPLTTKQKGEIKKSLDRVTSDQRVQPLNVKRWFVVTPWEPTPEALAWLRGLKPEGTFAEPIGWHGAGILDGWAASCPEVIDYYLGNGRTRLNDGITSLAKLLEGSLTIQSGRPINTGEAAIYLGNLGNQLNSSDPHFRYSLAYEVTQPDMPVGVEGLVVRKIRRVGESTWIRVDVFRGNAFLDDRMPPFTVTFKAERATASSTRTYRTS